MSFGATGSQKQHFVYLTFFALTTMSALPCQWMRASKGACN